METRNLRVLVLAVALVAQPGCGSRTASKQGGADPLSHTGSIDGFKYEISGSPKLKVEQIPDEKGEGDYPKVTCGSNWFSVRGKRLFANDLDYGTVVKPGDTIKVAADGKVFINGEVIPPLPKTPPTIPGVLPGEGNDLAE